jgi:hypothetical protein
MHRIAQLLFPWLSGAVAAYCLWDGIDVYRHQASYAGLSAASAFIGAGVFGTAAISVWRRWRVQRVLASIAGAILVLYALSVIFLGWEDVGGASVAVPLALASGAAGFLGFFTGGRETPREAA